MASSEEYRDVLDCPAARLGTALKLHRETVGLTYGEISRRVDYAFTPVVLQMLELARHPLEGAQILKVIWGYDADPITALFKRKFDLQLQAETLLSDAAIADELLAGRHPDCDILNINNAYIRDCLEPASLVAALDSELNELYRDTIHSLYQRFLPWSYNASGDLIGIGQRYGPFNLVINTDAISRASAEDQGFGLADDPAFRNRYAILDYPDFNLFHVCIGAGINPFQPLSVDALENFKRKASSWLQNALMLDADHHRLNRALLAGDEEGRRWLLRAV